LTETMVHRKAAVEGGEKTMIGKKKKKKGKK
jgi:hypothetical protein